MRLRYVQGDATRPEGDGPRIIVHCCNTIGAWGAGFVLALSRRWSGPERSYRTWLDNADGTPPIRYPAIREGLATVRKEAMRWALSSARRRASVHMPRMGAGLAGGDWGRIEHLVHDELVAHGVDVTVYDLA